MARPEPDDAPRRFKPRYENYLRYSALGLQMGGIILIGVLGGKWLDGLVHWKVPVFTLVFSVLSIAGAMIFLFKETKPTR